MAYWIQVEKIKLKRETWDRKRGEIIRGILIPKEGQSVARALEGNPC